jgi:NhaA family Na+:H+ antiporter
VLLLAATLVALVLANSQWRESWAHFWHLELGLSLAHWVNDALMALFFFTVGMEIKHELVAGQLATRQQAMLPVAGALGGMLAPAALYLLCAREGVALDGWGIPMATDIAFAVAALAVLGSRVPPALKIFLLALAIVDDLGAVTVIAVFYTEALSPLALAAAAAGLGLVVLLLRAGMRSAPLFLLLGAGIWLATLFSGVHATVAGVLLGLLVPARAEDGGQSPSQRLTHALHPWVAFGVMPVFALANAGVALDAATLGDPAGLRVALGVAVGLLLGKPIGITVFALLAARLGVARLPDGVGASALFGVGLLGGIGFTMALFIGALAFGDTPLGAAAKVGVLVASALACLGGVAWLARALPDVEAPEAGEV